MTGGNPPVQSQIAANPGKNTVTSATDAGAQQADVQRKLKLYGIIQAFSDGRMPDNEQIDEVLAYAIKTSPVELNKLSPDGKLLVEDIRDILETARAIVAEKNDGELFQNFVWSTKKGDITRGKKSKDELVPVSKDDAIAEGKQAAAHFRTLLTLFLTNSEARKLLSDLGFVARDMFATGAAKAADKARPAQEDLDQVDKPAPSGEWIGPDGKKYGKHETPELGISGPGNTGFRMNPKDDPANAQVTDHRGETKSAGQATNEAAETYNQASSQYGNAKETAKSQAQGAYESQGGKEGLKQQAKGHAQEVANSDDPVGTAKSKKDTAAGAVDENTPDQGEAQGTKDRLLNKIPDEHRERAANAIGSSKDFLRDVRDTSLPQERRDQFIYRLKKVVVECQEHKDYQEAIEFFLDKAETYKGHARKVGGHGADAASNVTDDPSYQQASLLFRTLLERFANGQSMQPLVDAVNALYADADNDSDLRAWFSEVDDYVHACLLEPGYILDDESDRRGQKIREDGRRFVDDKYQGHFDNLSNQIQAFFLAMGDDPLNVRFGEDWKRLTKDLLFNSEGNLTYKPKLWDDIRKVILPQLIENIGYVPIPRAEYSDESIDLVLENLVLQGTNLFPNIITVEANNFFSFSPYTQINKQQDTHHHVFRVGLSQIQADLRDVQFAFRRKKGFPKIRDSGLADVLIGGKGITVDIAIETIENRRDTMIKLKSAKSTIDTLKFTIRDSRHDLLYKFVKATATGLIKKAIEAAMYAAIRQAVEYLDEQLVEVRNRMEDADNSDEVTKTQALKDLFAKKKESAQEKKETVDEKTGTFKLVVNENDSVVKDLEQRQTQNSWSKRQFKTADLATSGKEWRSPVFSILSDRHPAVTGEHHPESSKTSGNAAPNKAATY